MFQQKGHIGANYQAPEVVKIINGTASTIPRALR